MWLILRSLVKLLFHCRSTASPGTEGHMVSFEQTVGWGSHPWSWTCNQKQCKYTLHPTHPPPSPSAISGRGPVTRRLLSTPLGNRLSSLLGSSPFWSSLTLGDLRDTQFAVVNWYWEVFKCYFQKSSGDNTELPSTIFGMPGVSFKSHQGSDRNHRSMLFYTGIQFFPMLHFSALVLRESCTPF